MVRNYFYDYFTMLITWQYTRVRLSTDVSVRSFVCLFIIPTYTIYNVIVEGSPLVDWLVIC